MPRNLPKPIADFVNANATLYLEEMLRPFAPDAVITDNGQAYEGQAGVRRLFEEEVLPVNAIFTPDSVHEDGDQVVVEGPAHGDFPGSPLPFTYRFTLADEAIKALEISL